MKIQCISSIARKFYMCEAICRTKFILIPFISFVMQTSITSMMMWGWFMFTENYDLFMALAIIETDAQIYWKEIASENV